MAEHPSRLSNFYQDQTRIAKGFGHSVYDIVHYSINFDRTDFENHSLYLSEAYCLLWQNGETGKVCGRRLEFPLKIGVFAALFVDLHVNIYRGKEIRDPSFHIISDLVEEFLDIAAFRNLVKSGLKNQRNHEL